MTIAPTASPVTPAVVAAKPIHLGDLQTNWGVRGVPTQGTDPTHGGSVTFAPGKSTSALTTDASALKHLVGVQNIDQAAAAAQRVIKPSNNTIIALLSDPKGGYDAAPVQLTTAAYNAVAGAVHPVNFSGWTVTNDAPNLVGIVAGGHVTSLNFKPLAGPIVAH